MKKYCKKIFVNLVKKQNKVYPSPRLEKEYIEEQNLETIEHIFRDVKLENINNNRTKKISNYQKVIPSNLKIHDKNNPYRTKYKLGDNALNAPNAPRPSRNTQF